MSVLSPKRVILFVAATLLALPLFANNPTPRLSARMAFDEESGVGVLFGGRGMSDPATGLEHATDETWLWVRNHWIQQFPAVRPPARSTHAMVYDSHDDQVIVFGGRKESTVIRQRFGLYNDTWAWVNGEWIDLTPASSPDARFFHGMAYDRDRDRVVLYGGFHYAADGKTVQTLTDTWEFDGETWTRVGQNGPLLAKPILVFDAARHQTILLGTNTEAKVEMYRWNTETGAWNTVSATALPPCVNEAQLVYQVHNERPLLSGGICSSSSTIEESYEWDGSTWNKITNPSYARTLREVDAAMTYDTATGYVIRFGGHSTQSSIPDSFTWRYRNRLWRAVTSSGAPQPRSMPVFRHDPERGVVWMFGGLSENSYLDFIEYLSDLWRYSDGHWSLVTPATLSSTPFGCATPAGAMDTDRDVLVVVCEGTAVYEWNGTDWKSFGSLNTTPTARRFASVAYDETLKKVVLFGGYDDLGRYKQDTWTWNGTAWTEVKPKNKPEHRAQAVMWYDPLAKKTILYSGAGTGSIEDHAERFSDMWAFNGTDWTRIVENAAPGVRFAPQTVVDPNSGKLLMFGGLRATIDEDDRVTQFYDNDLWVWDGSANSWTEIQTPNAPSPRQNGAFDYDPASGKFVLIGGFAGNFYLSDRWLWDGETWTVVQDTPSFRRRSARP